MSKGVCGSVWREEWQRGRGGAKGACGLGGSRLVLCSGLMRRVSSASSPTLCIWCPPLLYQLGPAISLSLLDPGEGKLPPPARKGGKETDGNTFLGSFYTRIAQTVPQQHETFEENTGKDRL